MNKQSAVFLATTTGLLAAYLVLTAIGLQNSTEPGTDDQLTRGVWIAVGADMVVFLCALVTAVTKHIASGEDHVKAENVGEPSP